MCLEKKNMCLEDKNNGWTNWDVICICMHVYLSKQCICWRSIRHYMYMYVRLPWWASLAKNSHVFHMGADIHMYV